MRTKSRWTDYIGAVLATVVINALLFTGMPLMTQVAERKRSALVEMPILIANIKPPKPPTQEKERQLEERKLKSLPDKQKSEAQAKPKSDGSQFEFAGKMGAGAGGVGIKVGTSAMSNIKDMKSDLQKIEFEISEVDTPPAVVSKTPAIYPFGAKRQGVRGQVVIRCLIGLDGKPDKIKVFSSEPAGVFDEAALSAVEKWRFKPGVLGGQQVPTWVRIPFKFELD